MPVTAWQSPAAVAGVGWDADTGTLVDGVAFKDDSNNDRHEDGSDDLISTSFGFLLPTGAVVDGIEVYIEVGRAIQYAGVTLHSQLTLDGTTKVGDDRTKTITHPGDNELTIGGPTVKYGLPLTRGDVISTDFGVAFWFTQIEEITEIRIDQIQMRVHYSDEGTGVIPIDLASKMRRIPPRCGVNSRQTAKRKE